MKEKAKQIADDLSAVLKEAKSMGCKEVKYFHNIPLKNVEIVVESLKKHVPKKPIEKPIEDTCLYYENYCPNCEVLLFVRYKHCPKCGQKLDWSEEE